MSEPDELKKPRDQNEFVFISTDINLYIYKARLLNVVDADTLDMEIDVGFNNYMKKRVRLAGINAYEAKTLKGDMGTQRVKEILEDKELYIKTFKDKNGSFGRVLGVIFYVEEDREYPISLNMQLLKEEHAVYYKYASKKEKEGLVWVP